jgi:transposase
MNSIKITTTLLPERWYNEFSRGRDSLEDEPKSGGPNTATNEEMVEKLHEVTETDPKSTYLQLQEQLKISSFAVHTIFHEKLNLHWICQ